MPDATGLELLAADLRTQHADVVLDTEFFRDKAALHVAPGAIGDTLEFLRGRGTEEFVEDELDMAAARHAIGISGGGRMGTSA